MSKNLYVFDFDETLVTCDSYTYVLNDKQERIRKLDSEAYHLYVPNPGETLDVSEFDEVVNPHIHESVFSLLRQYKDDAVILTARTKDKPVKTFLLSQGIDIPVYAIGSDGQPKNRKLVNAKRKAKWIYNAASSGKYEYIEFWDDYPLNVELSKDIMLGYPNILFKAHIIKH